MSETTTTTTTTTVHVHKNPLRETNFFRPISTWVGKEQGAMEPRFRVVAGTYNVAPEDMTGFMRDCQKLDREATIASERKALNKSIESYRAIHIPADLALACLLGMEQTSLMRLQALSGGRLSDEDYQTWLLGAVETAKIRTHYWGSFQGRVAK